jgi:hypothetical protein
MVCAGMGDCAKAGTAFAVGFVTLRSIDKRAKLLFGGSHIALARWEEE